MSDFYKEKENQTDAELIDSNPNDCNYTEIIRQQQNEIEQLNDKIKQQVTNYM